MPVTLEQAEAIAKEQLGRSNEVRITATEKFDVGWVFSYQSARYLETGDASERLAGNAPLFVSRADGATFYISYHRPLTESMEVYRACGNPNGTRIPRVELRGWAAGASAVAAIQAVRAHSSSGLAEAKAAVEACLADQPSIVTTMDVSQAERLVNALAAAGFKAAVCYAG